MSGRYELGEGRIVLFPEHIPASSYDVTMFGENEAEEKVYDDVDEIPEVDRRLEFELR